MNMWWSAFWMTVQEELFHLPEPEHAARLAVRALAAALLGGILGYERQRRGTAAGIRTHMLVALGSALFVLVPLSAGMAMADMSRVFQGVISGIGFLGAGAVIKLSQDRRIRGLTTAASIWATAAIGAAAGMGMMAAATFSTLLALFILSHLHGRFCCTKASVQAKPEDDESRMTV